MKESGQEFTWSVWINIESLNDIAVGKSYMYLIKERYVSQICLHDLTYSWA
jgi:hypothetical protein